MALGGGSFLTQNKILPGSYINFVSSGDSANIFGERGTGAIGIELDYFTGDLQEIIVITKEDFLKNSLAIFGYEYSDEEVAWVKDFFKNGKTLIVGALNSNGAAKASNTYCTAKSYGQRGNDLKIVIQTNVDETNKFDVSTYLGTTVVDKQTVAKITDIKDNDFVAFKMNATLSETAGANLSGGKSGTVTGSTVQKFLTNLESYNFNAVTVCGHNDDLLVEWTKRMRDEVGKKFQCVVYDVTKPDYEGCVCIAGAGYGDFENTAPWVCGALSGCEINKSLTNKIYDGEYLSQEDALYYASSYSQTELEDLINKGVFAFHRVGNEVRVLADINSLVTTTSEKSDLFCSNQTMRVCDQIGMDIATIFNTRYLGVMPNDNAGRIALWADIVKYMKNLETLRAIENFTDTDVVVEQGNVKKAVVVNTPITVVNCMEQLYMTVKVN